MSKSEKQQNAEELAERVIKALELAVDYFPPIFFAQSRGLNIHSLRVALAHRHRHGELAPAMRDLARSCIARLRELGPGNVLLPDEHLGKPLDWWGPRDAS